MTCKTFDTECPTSRCLQSTRRTVHTSTVPHFHTLHPHLTTLPYAGHLWLLWILLCGVVQWVDCKRGDSVVWMKCMVFCVEARRASASTIGGLGAGLSLGSSPNHGKFQHQTAHYYTTPPRNITPHYTASHKSMAREERNMKERNTSISIHLPMLHYPTLHHTTPYHTIPQYFFRKPTSQHTTQHPTKAWQEGHGI